MSSRAAATEAGPLAGKAALQALLRGYSLELTPHAGLDAAATAALLGAGRTIYLTALPGRPFTLQLEAAAKLRRAGLRPVPHLAARRFANAAALEDFLARARGEAEVDDLLVIAGDEAQPHGPFPDSLAVLASGALERAGIRRVALAAYPEGHPRIGDERLAEALRAKCAAAARAGLEARLVTQFCFAPDSLAAWLERPEIAALGVPVHVGLAGLASVSTLLAFARRCGVALSLGMLRRNSRALANLLAQEAPDAMLAALAERPPGCGVRPARIHFFPFGGVERTVRWADALLGHQ